MLLRLLSAGPLLSLRPPEEVYFLGHRPTPWGSLSQLEGREEEQKESRMERRKEGRKESSRKERMEFLSPMEDSWGGGVASSIL